MNPRSWGTLLIWLGVLTWAPFFFLLATGAIDRSCHLWRRTWPACLAARRCEPACGVGEKRRPALELELGAGLPRRAARHQT